MEGLPFFMYSSWIRSPHFRFLYAWRLWAIVCLLSIVRLIWFALNILLAPNALRIQYIPDDAFYYLQLAKNFSRLGTWTFDSGVSETSGFHLINAYLLSAVSASFHPNTDEFINLGLTLSAGLTLAALLLAWRVGWRKKSAPFFLTLFWLANTRNFFFNSVSLTEWSQVVLTALLYALALARYWEDTRLHALLLMLCLGVLGGLTRSDFGLFPFGLFVGATLISILKRRRMALEQTFVGLVGAAVGVGIVFLHNYYFTGQVVQSSALMKAYWAQLYPVPFLAAISLPPQLLGVYFLDTAGQIALCVFTGATAGFLLLKRMRLDLARDIQRHGTNENQRELAMALGSAIALASYLIFYANNAAVQPWYTGTLLVPAFILVFALAKDLAWVVRPHKFPRLLALVFLCALVSLNILDSTFLDSNHAPWPSQRAMYEAGQALANLKLGHRIGAWNAGILGYFQGGTLVNLDGLVNNDIYPYAIHNTLPTYLYEKDIRYVIDYENLFLAPYMRRRGGYDNAEFLKTLHPLQAFDDGRYGYGRLTLYELVPQ